MAESVFARIQRAYRDINSDHPVRFHLPLNEIFHTINQDLERLPELGVDPVEFEYMRFLGYAKETVGMNGVNLHHIFREVIYDRCNQLLDGPKSNQLPETVRKDLADKRKKLEKDYPDLKR